MRITYDVRINQQPERFLVFDFPNVEQPAERFAAEELHGIEGMAREELATAFKPTPIELREFGVQWGSLDFLIDLAIPAQPYGWAVAGYFVERAMGAHVDRALLRVTDGLREQFRRRPGRAALAQEAEIPSPDFAGDLLGVARRVAIQEASMTRCVPQLLGIPEIQAGCYKAEFALSGEACGASLIVVTVDYDGKGYRVKRR